MFEKHKILTLDGEIDLHRSPALAREMQSLIKEQPQKLVIDLSKVDYMDSSGLAVLLEGMQNVEHYGGKLYLIGMGDSLRTVFESSRLEQVFRIHPNLESVLTAAG